MVQTPRILSSDLLRTSKRLIISYVVDWVVILAGIGAGAGFSYISPNKHPFSLVDPNISYPYVEDSKIPGWLLFVLSLGIPLVVIPLVTLFLVPGPTIPKGTPKSLIWRRKIWELNTGWMGLGLSLAVALILTDGIKNLTGKPRPDLLARCQPDIDNYRNYIVSAFELYDGFLVSSAICQNTDMGMIDDGFRSFPSGHASYSAALLTYLTLFLCSKFAIAIPFLAKRTPSPVPSSFSPPHHHDASSKTSSQTITPPPSSTTSSQRNLAAAPPVHLLVLAFFPIALAIYIASTRYSDFRHHGFDIIVGSLLGLAIGWFSFRWYHLPIRQGAGWAWGARSKERAFGVGVGVQGYVGDEGWGNEPRPDLEGGGGGNGGGRVHGGGSDETEVEVNGQHTSTNIPLSDRQSVTA